MSAENVKAFIEKLNSDEAFRNQIAGAGSHEKHHQRPAYCCWRCPQRRFHRLPQHRQNEQARSGGAGVEGTVIISPHVPRQPDAKAASNHNAVLQEKKQT